MAGTETSTKAVRNARLARRFNLTRRWDVTVLTHVRPRFSWVAAVTVSCRSTIADGMLSMSDCLANALENYVHERTHRLPGSKLTRRRSRMPPLRTWKSCPKADFWSHDLLGSANHPAPPCGAMLFIADDSYNARDEKEADRFLKVAQRGGCGRRHSQQGAEPTILRWSQGGRLDCIYFRPVFRKPAMRPGHCSSQW